MEGGGRKEAGGGGGARECWTGRGGGGEWEKEVEGEWEEELGWGQRHRHCEVLFVLYFVCVLSNPYMKLSLMCHGHYDVSGSRSLVKMSLIARDGVTDVSWTL